MEYDNTTIEKFVELVKNTKDIKLEDATRSLSMDVENLMKIAEILSRQDIIRISYTIAGETFFKQGVNINKQLEEKALEAARNVRSYDTLISSEDKTEKVDKIVEEIRKRIQEKKYRKSESPPQK